MMFSVAAVSIHGEVTEYDIQLRTQLSRMYNALFDFPANISIEIPFVKTEPQPHCAKVDFTHTQGAGADGLTAPLIPLHAAMQLNAARTTESVKSSNPSVNLSRLRHSFRTTTLNLNKFSRKALLSRNSLRELNLFVKIYCGT